MIPRSVREMPVVATAAVDQPGAAILLAHADVQRHTRGALDAARRAGELLRAAKAQRPHGTWLPWLGEHCPGVSVRTAQAYMRVAEHWQQIVANAQDAAHLTLSAALERLSGPRRETGSASDPVSEPQWQPAESQMSAETREWLADRDGWAPLVGSMCLIEAVESNAGETVDVLIEPSVYDGFWYLNVFRAANGVRWAIVDGTKKPVAGWALQRFVNRSFGLDGLRLSEASWTAIATRWAYNQALFGSLEEWRADWLSGAAQ